MDGEQGRAVATVARDGHEEMLAAQRPQLWGKGVTLAPLLTPQSRNVTRVSLGTIAVKEARRRFLASHSDARPADACRPLELGTATLSEAPSQTPAPTAKKAIYRTTRQGALICTLPYSPEQPSRIASYRFGLPGPQTPPVVRRVTTPDGRLVLKEETIVLAGSPKCACGSEHHVRSAQDAFEALRVARRRRPSSAQERKDERWASMQYVHRMEQAMLTTDAPQRSVEYDGGYEAVVELDANGAPIASGNQLAWEHTGQELDWQLLGSTDRRSTDESAQVPAHLCDIAGADPAGETLALAPIVDEAIAEVIAHVPPSVGTSEDLFQYGMYHALLEARKHAKGPGVPGSAFGRVKIAVRHRLIDLIRRQAAANRNLPARSLEAGLEAGMDVPASDTDPFDLLFRLPEERTHLARFRVTALTVYREARGLARRIIRRAYLGAIVGRSSRGTLELRDHPEYLAASQWLADAWARALAQAMHGNLDPASARRTRRTAGTAA